MDQNEKLVMYSVMHVAAVDGCGGMIVGFITMPVQNNVKLYCNLYRWVKYVFKAALKLWLYHRPIVTQYGLWDLIHVNQVKEWVLMLYIQETLAFFRHNTDCAPHMQSTSKQVRMYSCNRPCFHQNVFFKNHMVECIWVEINSCVNYPIKSCLIAWRKQATMTWTVPMFSFVSPGSQSGCQLWELLLLLETGIITPYHVIRLIASILNYTWLA